MESAIGKAWIGRDDSKESVSGRVFAVIHMALHMYNSDN